MKYLPQLNFALAAVARASWYQDKPNPGFPLERYCRVVDTVKVHTATGWARWYYCTIHGWVAPSTHLIEVLSGQVRS